MFSAVILSSFILTPFAAIADHDVSGFDTVFPVASIGVGNGNVPGNTGPTHEGVYNGIIPVYATFTDGHPSVYHFRVIADGAIDGHTCTDLFAPANQDYNTCGFLYNKSVYVSGSFTNQQIASLDTAMLGPDGKYWLIFGVKDESENRTSQNYLADARVSITTNNSSTVAPSPSPAPSSGGGGGGFVANGPIAGTFGVNFSGLASAGHSQSSGFVLGTQTCAVEYITTYIKPGGKNDPEDVKKLQIFLNEHFGLTIPVTGFYGPRTIAAVRKFQVANAAEVLRPWVAAGLHHDENTPTGYVYKTTKRMINVLKCPDLQSPIPQLP